IAVRPLTVAPPGPPDIEAITGSSTLLPFGTQERSHARDDAQALQEDPHRQPSAPSRDADDELRVRPVLVRGLGQAARLPDLDLRVPNGRGRARFLRRGVGSAGAAARAGRRAGPSAL